MDNEYIKNLEDALYEAIDIALVNLTATKDRCEVHHLSRKGIAC